MARVPAVLRGKSLGDAAEDEVDFAFDDADFILGSHASTIPFTNNVQAPRAFYGARFLNQAQAPVNRELPLIMRGRAGQDKSFDETYGKDVGALFADRDAHIARVDKNSIHLEYDDGTKSKVELTTDMPLNRKSGFSHIPKVKVGDIVKKGGLLADSSFTKDGALALGLNARIAVIPYKGYTMDDATAISESFAKRLATEHTYGYAQDFDDMTRSGKDHFASIFPTKFTKEQLEKLDENGVVKPGVTLEKGDPIFLATRPRPISSKTDVGGLKRGVRELRSDASQVWDSEDPGRVTDSLLHKDTARAFISTIKPVRVGDKLTLRHGQKNVVSKIIPDDLMLRGEDGQPFEMLLNPLSLPSRVNTATEYSVLLGKVAAKRGAPYRLPGFNPAGEDMRAFVEGEAAKHGVKLTETVYDPEDHIHIENPIATGQDYVLRLHHIAESKMSGRGVGSYDANEQPSRGGGEGAQAKRLSGLETAALLSSGAYGVLREGATLRGQKNDQFWRNLRSGAALPEPGAPFVWHKFRALMAGAGLRTHDAGGGKLRLGAFTDKDLAAREPVELKSGDTIDFHSLSPVKGGLFDPVMVESRKWGSISLPFPVVVPSMEDAARKALGITEQQYRDVVAGRARLSEVRKTR